MSSLPGTFTVVSHAGSSECVIRAAGEIDMATAPELRRLLRAQLAERPQRLVIDMAEVSFVDSSGLSELIAAFKQGQAAATEVVLRDPSRQVSSVLHVSGLDRVLRVIHCATSRDGALRPPSLLAEPGAGDDASHDDSDR